jgi:Domain of unknown function (DUF4345)
VAVAGIELTTATARNDVRAVYGGLEIGIAAFLVYCARRPPLVRAGLAASALAFGAMAAARLLSLAVDGVPSALGFALWAGEVAGVALSAAALRMGDADRPAPSAA